MHRTLPYLRGGHKSVGGRVCVIPGSEVPVEGCHNGVLFSLLHVTPEGLGGKRMVSIAFVVGS